MANANYGDCVSALRTSLSFLESSVSTLGSGVADYPRLGGVLKSHYELIPQPTLSAAESSLRDEIGPAIATLLDRADAHIARVDRRVDSLRARAELQQGRLDSSSSTRTATAKGKGKEVREAAVPNKKRRRLDGSARLRARVLSLRRDADRGKYSVERLELELLQKERELRKRLDSAA
ncbi:DASH complex subunit Spc19 [Xylariomycetidae sp. FL0641]|nr:DASH complex subunit Spc19 [Xylariomycetidae sp. FL0641]